MIIWDRKKKIILSIIIAVVVLGIAGGAWAYFAHRKAASTDKIPVNFSSIQTACMLDGTQVSKDTAQRHPLAVMVENHPDARPQAGIDKASIVYEAVTEGGITRYMLVFGCNDADKVGPVRSARTYYVDWAEEYNAFYAHAGGAQNALTKIAQDGVLDLPHNATAYWRQNDGRDLEHTLYTATPKLYQYAQNNGFNINTSDYRAWKFKSDASSTQRPQKGKGAIINFSGSPTYQVEWTYNPQDNNYLRTLAGAPQKDEITKQQLTAKNIIIAAYNRTAVESGGKQVYDFTTVGSGEAKILMDGTVITGTWKKEKPKQRTLFYDSAGKEIQFNPGQTWVEVVNPDVGSVTIE